MADFPVSQKVSFQQVHPVPQGWQCQGGDEQSVASFQLVRCQWHFCKARESIYFPKYTQASQNMQESICSCITNPCLSHVSRNHTAETRKALPLQTGAACAAAELPSALCTPTAIPASSGGKWTAFMVKIYLTLHLSCFSTETCFTHLPHWTAKFWSSHNCCDQSWHLPFHKAVVQMQRVENFLILPGQKLTTSKLSALHPSNYLAPRQSGVISKAATYFIFSPDIWQKELIFLAHEKNQLKNPSDCFSLVFRHLVPINVTVSHAHVSKRNTPLVHLVMSQHLELCHRFYSRRLSSPIAQGFFGFFFVCFLRTPIRKEFLKWSRRGFIKILQLFCRPEH